MAFECLQELTEAFEKAGQLVRIRETISPHLEMTEVCDRVVKNNGGPALLFDNPQGYGIPVLANLFGSSERVCAIFDIKRLEDLGDRIRRLLALEPPRGFVEKIKLLPRLRDLSRSFPREVRKAPCQEVVKTTDADLSELPILTCWPGDGGPFITMPVVITRHPQTGRRNVGMYRMHVYDSRTTGMHWHIHKGGAAQYRDAPVEKPFPVAVALGPDPITTYCATAPLPEGLDEFVLAGFLRGKPVELVRCVTSDLMVPAQSQIVLEGNITPGETRREGPFGDHTGFYSPADDYPVFRLKAITMRERPIYQTTVVGIPPMEDAFLGKITERLFLPLIQQQLPEILDINLPVEGCFHNLCFVRMNKSYPGQAQKVMHALWGMGQMMFAKMIFVFDREVDVQDLSQVLFYIGNHVDPGRDITIVRGPVDSLDHASDLPNLGTKMGVDCTSKGPGEGHRRAWPEKIKMSAAVRERIDGIWGSLGLR